MSSIELLESRRIGLRRLRLPLFPRFCAIQRFDGMGFVKMENQVELRGQRGSKVVADSL